MSFWRRPFSQRAVAAEAEERGPEESSGEISDGSVHYIIKKAGNDSEVSYQDAIGAPVEVSSPLGYSVGPVTIVFLNISKMIGTGIFSTRECKRVLIVSKTDLQQHRVSSRALGVLG